MKTKNAILIFALFVAAVPSPVFSLSCSLYGFGDLFCNLSPGDKLKLTKRDGYAYYKGTAEIWLSNGLNGCEQSSGSRPNMAKAKTETFNDDAEFEAHADRCMDIYFTCRTRVAYSYGYDEGSESCHNLYHYGPR
jgi:hypothetical protein